MNAIEFVTIQKDGIIEIPRQYINNLSKQIRVIILFDSDLPLQDNKPVFTSLEIDTTKIKFDRDEANER